MCSRCRRARGFTLVELLAVISIIVLLVSFLVPVVGRAQGIAVRAVCQNTLRFIGNTAQSFAAAHNGRSPGRCMAWAYYDTSEARGRTWVGYLNVEVLGQKEYWVPRGGAFIQQHGATPTKGAIYCPSIKFWGNLYPRAYQINIDAIGGMNWGPGALAWGPYGVLVTPPPPPIADDFVGPRSPAEPTGHWEYYTLGAVLGNFPNPGQQYLVIETEYANDNFFCDGTAPYRVTLGATPPYASTDQLFAFRHALPVSRSQYQSQATGNFLYIDGHVNYMTPNDRITAKDRYAYRP